MDGDQVSTKGEGLPAASKEECNELFLWKVGAQLDYSQCQILGIKLGINRTKLTNIYAKVQRGTYSQEEMNFEMLHNWMANQTPDDNPVAKLQEILVKELGIPTDDVRNMFKQENLLHESAAESSLGELQLYQICEKVDKGQCIPLILRLGLTFNELQASKQNCGGDIVRSLFEILCSWQKALSRKIDQVQSMCNILEECGQRMIAYNIRKNVGAVTYKSGKKSMQCGPNDSDTPGHLLSGKDLNVSPFTTSRIQDLLKFIVETSEQRPGQLDLTDSKLQDMYEECRCISKVLINFQRAVERENMYELSGFTVSSFFLHVRVHSEEGLARLKEDIRNGSIARRLEEVLNTEEASGIPAQMKPAKETIDHPADHIGVMATGRGIADDLLANLAEDIETGEQMEALGRALGFSAAAINRYTETNRLEGRVTCKGTRDMLLDWRQKVEPCYQHVRLKEELTEAGLVMLADTYLKETEIIPDIYSKKISESLTVGQCREKLKNKYKNSLCKIQKAPWDPNDLADFKDLHTVVTMVRKDARGKDTKKKEILQGSVDEIFSMKVNDGLPVRILVSAPAGRGKTTAVAKIAYDWANREPGSALENLPLLFVVKLRNTIKQTSIAEAIRSQLLNDVADLTQEGLHGFIKENQGICHILLDGLDEYAGIAANKGLGSNIVDVMLWEEFPDCRVLVTTRPNLENFFNQGELPRVYTKMWIEGFSHDNSREYIDKFFDSSSNASNGQGLKVYLDVKPLINELVITPLFCLMVCHLWSEGLLRSRTTTQTDLLDSVNIFLMQHANARSKPNDKITHHELGKIICKLGGIALAGLLDDAKKLVFTLRDFGRDYAILERACKLGILSKTTTQFSGLPQSHETSSTTIEFYHKLAQEHSAGKYLADHTNKYLLRWKISKLDRVLKKIRANIGDYENLIRFAAGTENSLCIRIMEALLDNSFLDESERYRILLDCSSETTGTEQGVSSLVQRCVAAQRILLKSPTVYTIVGMQNLPKQLKNQVRQVRLEGSAINFEVTDGLWSCLISFPTLHTITLSDCSLSFPPSPPKLTSVTKLEAERVTSQSYVGLVSSLSSLKEIDVTIDDVEGNTSQITASRPVSQTGDRHFPVHIKLKTLPSRLRDKKSESGKTIAKLGLLTREQLSDSQWLQVSGLSGRDEGALVHLFVMSTHLDSLNLSTRIRCGFHKNDGQAVKDSRFEMKYSQLSTVMTDTLWACIGYITSLHKLIISDSSLRFPQSPPELTSVTKLEAERVESQSYEGLLSSIPNVKEMVITVGNAEKEDLSRIQTSLCRHLTGQELTLIRLDEPLSEESVSSVSGETMRGLGLLISDRAIREATLSGVICGPEEKVIDLVQSSTSSSLMSSSLYTEQFSASVNSDGRALNISSLTIRDCKLTAMITSSMWSCLRSFPSLVSLIISDSSLSFSPSPPELASVTKLKALGVTSHSYDGLLSSIPNVKEIDVTIGNAEKEEISQIQTSLRRHLTGQELTLIRLDEPHSLPSEESDSGMSREKMRGLGLLAGDKAFHEATLSRIICGPEETVIDLVQSSTSSSLMSSSLYTEKFSASVNSNRHALNISSLTIRDCKLTSVVTSSMLSCLRSFPLLSSLIISDSSLSFPPSPPELTSVIKLEGVRVTSQTYAGLLSSLPSVEVIGITVDHAERDISEITAVLSRLGGQQLTVIALEAPTSLPPKKKEVSRETMRQLGFLIREQTKNLQILAVSGVNSGDEEDLVALIECCRHAKALNFLLVLGCGSKRGGRLDSYAKDIPTCKEQLRVMISNERDQLAIEKCQLSTQMTIRMWTCLRLFNSLRKLLISDSSLSFPPSPPELSSVTMLEAEKVTSQSYEGLLSSLPGLKNILITIDDVERDITQITAALRRTGGQHLTNISLQAQSSLPEKKTISRETMRGLGLLIREQTKNLQYFTLHQVKCTDEEDLVYLIECCSHVKAMTFVVLHWCGTREGGRLQSHLNRLRSSGYGLMVNVTEDNGGWWQGEISHIH